MPDSEPAPASELLREVEAFLAAHPDIKAVEALFADLSGVVRGKRYPIEDLPKLARSGLAFPASVFLLDTQGMSHDPGGKGFSDGDPDVFARMIPETLDPVPWSTLPLAQCMLQFDRGPGRPLELDPRYILKRCVDRLHDLGLKPVVAYELEFYLVDKERTAERGPQPPINPLTRQREAATQVYGMDVIDAYGTILQEIVESCTIQGVPTGAITAEYAPGQFEINLRHVDDPLGAADDCILFKRAVRGVARKHDLQATFMAKPYPERAGSGLHLHVSLVDKDGRNVFDGTRDGGSDLASPTLRHAIGGVLATLPDAMAILAPNVNSFRRFEPNIFVPINRSWGFENRSVALRVPIGDGASRRIEHRVAGADANPYLALATFLAGIHHGIVNEIDPGPPTDGNAGTAFDPQLPMRPRRAIETLAQSTVMDDYLGAGYPKLYAACKEAEYDEFDWLISPQEYEWYL